MKTASRIALLAVLALAGAAAAAAFFDFSEKKMQFRNSFVRRFPPHLADRLNDLDLKYGSYYLAGAGDGRIYLGNTTTPLYVTVLDTALRPLGVEQIKLDQPHPKMRQPQVRIAPPYVFAYEGSAPYLYRGSVSDWELALQPGTARRFSQLQPLDSGRVAVRFDALDAGVPTLGTIASGRLLLADGLLGDAGGDDALFHADGLLLASASPALIHYVYFYKNSFLTAGKDFTAVRQGKTIDTVAVPNLKLTRIGSRNEKTFAEMPLLVNRLAASDGRWLFVNSQLRGRHDPESLWKTASILDIYDTSTGAYLASGYLHDIDRRKVSSFLVSGGHVYALSGRHLIRYVFRKELIKKAESSTNP